MFDEIVKEIETRCKNPLETQSSIAHSYANMLRYLDFISDDKIKIANNAIKARYPSKSGLARVKKMAWAIVEKRQTTLAPGAVLGACLTCKDDDFCVGDYCPECGTRH
jgi:hypothetical protein